MLRDRSQTDYEPVTRPRRQAVLDFGSGGDDVWPAKARTSETPDAREREEGEPIPSRKETPTLLRRGHSLTYAGLFLFTLVLYARPAEFYPSPLTVSLAFYIAVITLAIFLVSQLALEGTLTARPVEVNLVLLFCLAGLLSIPFAIDRAQAWATFSDIFIRCVMIFIVMINAVRSEARLKGLLLLALGVSIWLSLGALNDYRLGLMIVEGYRAGGRGSGIFGNSNDMALHIVTILPIAIALLFGGRGIGRKLLYAACALLMIAAIVLTYSRGGFIGMLVVLGFLAWKIGRRHRLGIAVCAFVIIAAFLALAPGDYSLRLASIFIPSLDPVGSSDMRREILYRSVWTALRHPLFGIGMGNFPNVSFHNLVSHNSYTQVAAEMGMAALVIYTLFIVKPFRRLAQIARETFATDENSRYYYLSIGLQASLLGYAVCSFFASVAYVWYVYYLVGFAVCLRRLYEAETGRTLVLEKASDRKRRDRGAPTLLETESAS